MTPTKIVQQFKQLNRSSPQFPDQLTSLLYGKEYKECIPKLQDQEVVWLVEYLDAVCLYFSRGLFCAFLNANRFWILLGLILPVLPSGNACVSS